MNKQILPIAIIAILASAAAYMLLKEKPVVDEMPKVLFEDFSDNADKLLSIKISSGDGIQLKATKGMATWSAHLDKLNTPYPVDQEKLKKLVEALAKSKVRERKTSKEAFFERLGLQSLDATDSQATLLELSDGKKIWELLIGNKASSGAGHFVRLPDQSQAWLLDTIFPLPSDENSWLKETVFDIEQQQISSIKRVDEKSWMISATFGDELTYKLENIPEGRQLKYDGVVEGMITNLVSLNFDDLMSKESFDLSAGQKLIELEVTLSDGEVYLIDLFAIGEDFYLSASTNDIENKKYWSEVLYKVSNFTAGQMNKTKDDFLDEVENGKDIAPAQMDEGEAPGE